MRETLYEYCYRTNKLHLLDEWDKEKNAPLTPKDVTRGTRRSVWWNCKQGHSWRAAILSRTSAGVGCPICDGKAVVSGDNDLQTAFPEIAAQWDDSKNSPLRPDQVTPYANLSVWWRCQKGHTWKSLICTRTYKGSGCPYCAGRKVLAGFSDLASNYPDIAAQWHPTKNGTLTSDQVSWGSRKAVWWQCSKGHEWKAIVYSRTRGGCCCPVCANCVVQAGYNDLKTLYPALTAEWDIEKNAPMTPDQIGAGSLKKVWWRCPQGHSYQSVIAHRTRDGYACPYCSGRKVLAGFNDLATRRPELAAQWHPSLNGALTPQMVTAYSSRTVWWRCPEGHVWKAVVCQRSRGYCNCPVCTGRIVGEKRKRYMDQSTELTVDSVSG